MQQFVVKLDWLRNTYVSPGVAIDREVTAKKCDYRADKQTPDKVTVQAVLLSIVDIKLRFN